MRNHLLLVSFMLGLTALTAACTDSDDDDAGGSGPTVPIDDDPGEPIDDSPTRAAIDVDNHVALLAAVFDAVAGTPHVEVGARVTAFADSATPHRSEIDPESFHRSQQYDCGGGGIAGRDRFELAWPAESEPLAPAVIGGWGFSECVAGTDTIDGTVDITADGLASNGISIRRENGERLHFVGTVRHSPHPNDPAFQFPAFATEASGASLERSDATGEHFVLDLTSAFRHGILVGPHASRLARLDARLILVSPLTGGRAVTVETVESFEHATPVPNAATTGEWHFTRGRLELDAVDGSSLVLEADTGDLPTAATADAHARITLRDPEGATTELIEPWSLWHENLVYQASQRPWEPTPLEPDPRADGSAVIGAGSALTLLDEVFAVFAGGEQRRSLMAARSFDLSTEPIEQRTVGDIGLGSHLLQSANCEGGGTLAGRQEIPSGLGATDGHWVYDGCTSTTARYDGDIKTHEGSFVTSFSSEAFTVETLGTGSRLILDGTVMDHHSFSTSDSYRVWRLHDTTLTEERDDGEHVVDVAETSFGYGSADPVLWRAHLGGHFVLRSPATGGRAVHVETLENFTLDHDRLNAEGTETIDPEPGDWQFPVGRLRIRAGDGSELIADAAAAGAGGLRVRVDDGSGTVVESDEDWVRWRDVLSLTP